MPTFGDLIDEVISNLYGHVGWPATGTLVGDITADALELALDFGDNPGAARPNGLVEIDRELIAVTRYNPTNGVATVGGRWGRGQRGTTAVTHDEGAQVTVNPRYPRQAVGNAINDALSEASDVVFGVRDLDPIVVDDEVALGYTLPADTLRVLRVEVESDGPRPDRRSSRDWTLRTSAGLRELQLNGCAAYSTVYVTVATLPGRMTAEGNDFADTTGLAPSAKNLAVYGALSNLVLAGEAARLQLISPEANNRADKVPAGSATALARLYKALFQQAKQAEQVRLQQAFPIQLLRKG
jgi:hypothetical protein